MTNYIIADDPHEALEKIYQIHGKDYGPVTLQQVYDIVWTYEIERVEKVAKCF